MNRNTLWWLPSPDLVFSIPQRAPNFLDQGNATSCFVAYVVNVKAPDKSGGGRLQLDSENLPRKACGVHDAILDGARITQDVLLAV